MADLIPWKRIEQKYAELFSKDNGRPAYPVRVALGALILKERMKSADEELVLQIQESQYLRMVQFRKRLGGNILRDVNAMIIEARKEFLGFIRNRKPSAPKIRKALRQQLQYDERKLRTIVQLQAESGVHLTAKQHEMLG